jgi:Chs5-Arf1p-binding protein BUD7/BCH1
LVKEKKTSKFTSKSTVQGFFHYVFGLETSSQATVAAYISKIAQLDPKQKVAKCTLGIFCIYDIFTKQDIRVEISMPGGISIFAVAENRKKFAAQPKWENLRFSSQIRSISPQPFQFARVLSEFPLKT